MEGNDTSDLPDENQMMSEEPKDKEEEAVVDTAAKMKEKKEKDEATLMEETIDLLLSMVCLPNISHLKWTNHHRTLVGNFLKNPEDKILSCSVLTIQGADNVQTTRLSVSLSLPLGQAGSVWYFLKMVPSSEKLTATKLSSHLTYGTIQPSDKTSLLYFFDNVLHSFFVDRENAANIPAFYPVYKTSKSTSAFLSTVHDHHDKLVNVSCHMYLLGAELIHQVSLAVNEPNFFVPKDAVKSCELHLQVKQEVEDVDIINNLEELLLHWMEQLHLFLFSLGQSPSPTEKGLLHEIRRISSNAELLQNVLDIIESPSVALLLTFLNSQFSAFPFMLSEIMIKIKNFLKDLNSNCRHLMPLETPLERIYVDQVDSLLTYAFDAMAILKILWNNSAQYHDIHLMEDYFLRLSWEIVRACQFYLPLENIFSPVGEGTEAPVVGKPAMGLAKALSKLGSSPSKEGPIRVKESPIDGVIKCCEQWRKCYAELLDHFHDKGPDEQWLPQIDIVFLPVDLFIARCLDLRFIWESKIQLSRYNEKKECILTIRSAASLEKYTGPEVDLLEEELSQIDKVLKEALKTIGTRGRHVFNLTSKDWLKYFDHFREKVEEIEQRYQCVMVSAVQTVENTLQGVDILNVFRPLSTRKSLFPIFFIMLDNVLDVLEKNFDKVEKQYVFRSLRVGKQNFSFCEMATWASGIRKKLEQEISMIRSQPWLPYYPRLDAMYHRWSKTSKMLKQVVKTTYNGWISSLPNNFATKLRQPVFKWKFDMVQTLEPNFDRELYTELQETRAWKALGFGVPDKIKLIFDIHETLFELKEKVEECGTKYNNLVKCISKDEAQLFEANFHQMITIFYPGLTSIIWTQKQAILNLCKKAAQLIETSDKKVDEYLSKNQLIWNELESLKNLIFYTKVDYVVYVGHEFQKDLLKQREVIVVETKGVFGRIEELLSNLHDSLLCRNFPNTQVAFLRYSEKVDNLLLKNLKDILKRSFLAFEGLLVGCRSCPSEHLAPVFEISVSLKDDKIVCNPSIDDIRETIVRMKEVFEISFAGVFCLLRRFSLEAAKAHDHKSELEDETTVLLQERLIEEFSSQAEKLEASLNEWSKFRDLWEVDQEVFFESYSSKEPNIEAFNMDISSIQFKAVEVNAFPELKNCGIFRINYAILKREVNERCDTWIKEFLKHLYSQSILKFQVLKTFVCDTTKLLQISHSSLRNILESKNEYKLKISALNDNNIMCEKLLKIFDVLIFYEYSISEKQKLEIERLNEDLVNLKGNLEEAVVSMTEKLEKYRKEYIIKNMEINIKIETIKQNYKHKLPTRSKTGCIEAMEALKHLLQFIEDIKQDLMINEDLKLLDLPLIFFPEVTTYEWNIRHLEEIWKIQEEWNTSWNTWSGFLVYEVSCVSMQEMLSGFQSKLNALNSVEPPQGEQVPKSRNGKLICRWEMEDDLLRQIDYTKLLVPLIINFQNAKLKAHHWENIKVLTATNFDESTDNLTVGNLQTLNLVIYQKELAEVFAGAAEELKTANSLNNIEVLSNELTLNMKHIPSIGIYIIKSTSEVTNTVKEFLMRLDVIASSRYARYYSEAISNSRAAFGKILTFLKVIEEFQREWIKWDMFFHSPDVRSFLITLSSIFDSINKRWRIITSLINGDPRLRLISMKEEIFNQLKEALNALKQLGYHTEPYLLDRCMHYPRFCFLSMDDLVGAISTVYDGESAKPYLNKLFMNIDKIKQQKSPKQNEAEIIGVYSKEGEFLELNSYIFTGGEFDVWLSKLDKAIQSTLKDNVKQCRNAFKSFGVKVDEVIKVWPLQVCVLAYLLTWSLDINKMFSKGKNNEELIKKLVKKIGDTILRISQVLNENMPKLLREKVRLFFIHVLQIRDQIDLQLKGSNLDHGYFISYNWDKDLDEIFVQIKPYALSYSWEYQGLWRPIVFTPDLVRSMSSITTYVVRGYAVGVLGKESSGKTETIKCLARMCGRNYKSVILAEEMDTSTLSLLLFGVCQTHTWLVFEKAHNIPLTVLPTLGDNLLKVKDGISLALQRTTSKTPNMIQIDGLNVCLDSRASVFFEIDAHQSSQFMECAREFCRPVAVSAPKAQVIGECLFALLGVEDARKYAKKLSTIFKLLSQAYPQEYCSRFGIPVIISIISCYKKLLRQPTEIEKEDMLPNAVRTVLLPQLRTEHIPIFDDIFETVFADFEFNLCWKTNIKQAILDELEKGGCWAPTSYIVEILHLYEVIKWNQKIIIVGNPNCGKSLAVTTLVNAINHLSNDETTGHKPIILEHLCPQSMTKETLFGTKNLLQGYTERGYVVHLLDKVLRSTPAQDIWIVLEGFYSYSWIEEFLNRFQVEQNIFKSLNSHFVEIPHNIKFIFIISGCNDVAVDLKMTATFNFDKDEINWKNLLLYKLQSRVTQSIYNVLKKMIDLHLPNFLDVFKLSKALNSRMSIKVDAFLAIVAYFISKLNINEQGAVNISELLTPTFIFSVIWSFGSEVAWSVSSQLTEIVTRISEVLPPDCNVMDLTINTTNGQFCKWEEVLKSSGQKEINNFKASVYSYLCSIFISSSHIPILLKGTRGSGKSTTLKLLKQMTEFDESVILHFNAILSPCQLNSLIKKVEMKGVGDDPKRKIMLIDDLECFKNDDHLYDTLAYLRYVLKRKCLFDEDNDNFHPVQQLNLCCAFQTTGKEENEISKSKTRGVDVALSETFHILTLSHFENDNFKELFESLYKVYFYNFEQDVNCMKDVITEALLYLYNQANPGNESQKMIVYHPNIIENFVKGIALCNQEYLDRESFIKIFVYESYRNFYDSSLLSLDKINEICNEIVSSYFCLSLDIISTNQMDLIYTRLGNVGCSYTEATIIGVKNFLMDSNESQDRLIIFHSFIRHVTNMARVIGVQNNFACRAVNGSERKFIGGNILLAGPEGIGKKTCVRFVAQISGWLLIELAGTVEEEKLVIDAYRQNSKKGVPTVVLIDSNYLESVENIPFLNNLMLEAKSSTSETYDLCIVVLVSCLADIDSLYKYIPVFFQSYSVDTFYSWTDDDLTEISLQILKDLSKGEPCFGELEKVSKILNFIKNSFQTERRYYGLTIPSSKFILMADLVLKYSKLEFKKLRDENHRMTTNIAKFEETDKSVQDLSNQLKKQHSQVTHIQQTCGNTILKMRNIKSEQSRLEQELTKKASLLSRQKEEAQRIRDLINRDLNDPRIELEAVHKELVRITKEDFDDLKKVLRPTPSVEGIFEIAMILVGYEPSWNEVKKQITNSLDFISKVRKVSIEDASDQILSQIRTTLTSEKFNEENISSIPPVAYTFLKWINIFLKFARIYRDYFPLKMQADALEKDMEVTQTTIKSYQHDLANFSVQHKVLMGQLQERETILESAEEKMKTLESKIQLALSVMEQLTHDKQHWETSVQKSLSEMEKVVGNSVLIAGYFTYLGYYKLGERDSFIECWKNKMIELGIKFSENIEIVSVIAPLDMRVKWQANNLKMDRVALESVALLTESPISQIVYDPLEVLSEWLQANDDIEIIDIRRKDFSVALIKCAREGKWGYINVNTVKLPFIVRKFLRFSSKPRSEEEEIRLTIGKESYKIANSFKLLITVNSLENDIPNDLSPFVNFVNIFGDADVLHRTLSYRLFEGAEKEAVENMAKHQRDLLDKRDQVFLLQTNIQDQMSHFDEALSEESNLMETLQAACIKASELRTKCQNIEDALILIFGSLKTFEPTAKKLAQLYILLDKLFEAERFLVVGYQRFINLVVDEVAPKKVVRGWGSVLDQNTLLLAAQNLYRFFQQQESGYRLIAAGLLLGSWYESNLGLIPKSTSQSLYEHKNNMNETSFKNPLDSWLPDQTWNNAITLSAHKSFIDILSHMENHSKLWKEWCESEQPENMALPRHMEKLIKGVARVALIRNLRPDKFLEAASIYVDRILRMTQKPLNLSQTLISLASGSNFYEPVILKSLLPLPVENILRKILPVCHPALATDPNALRIISMGAGQEGNIKCQIKSCSEKGHWLLIKCPANDEDMLCTINSELQNIQKKGANRRFKLWFYNLSNCLKPRNFFLHGSTILLNLPTLLRESIEHLYELVGETRIIAYSNDVMKLHLISLAILHVACEVRQEFLFDENSISQKICEVHWSEVEVILRDFITGTFPESMALSTLVKPIYTSGCINDLSFSIFSRMVEHYLSPKTISEITSYVSSLTHYTVPRTCDLADHLTQLEFIFKAPSCVPTCASPTLFVYQQISICREVETILQNVLGETEEFDQVDLETKLIGISNQLKSYNDGENKILNIYLNNEICALVRVVNTALTIIRHPDNQGFLEVLSPITESEVIIQNMKKEEAVKYKLQSLRDRGNYVTQENLQALLLTNLDLGKFVEPLCFWSWFVRKVWLETNSEDVVAVSLTRSDVLVENVSAEGSSEVLLQNLLLVGCSWKSGENCLKKEETPYLTHLAAKTNILVTPLTDSIQKALKMERVFRAPVLKNLLSGEPLFWINVGMDESLTEQDCVFRAVRFLLS